MEKNSHSDKDWLRTRKKLLQQVKSQVSLRLGAPIEELRAYSDNYKNEFVGQWAGSNAEKLLNTIEQSSIVLGGDFHVFPQAQRTHLRILRRLVKRRPVVLALECFESKFQDELDDFLAGDLDEAEFLKLIQWEQRWSFPWSNYKQLVDFAHKKRIPIYGVNRFFGRRDIETLKRRDLFAAQRIYKIAQQNPEAIVYTIYGDLHLASDHMPKQLEELVGLPISEFCVRIFQNSERLYFRLAQRQLENDIEVLSSSGNRFCILGSPPWVKWQSYLMYLEHTYDAEIEEESETNDSLDFTDHILSLLKFLQADLQVSIDCNELAVYTANDRVMWNIMLQGLPVEQIKAVDRMIKNDRSFFLPEVGVCYLSRQSINHAATLAGYFLQAKLSGRKNFPWDIKENFIGMIWIEAVGYFVSKLINHKRKTESIRDLKAQLASLHPQDQGREALLLCLDQRLTEVLTIHNGRLRPRKYKPRKKLAYIEASRLLGYMLGERLYLADRKGTIPHETLIGMLSKDVFDADFDDFYLSVIKRLEAQTYTKKRLQEVGL